MKAVKNIDRIDKIITKIDEYTKVSAYELDIVEQTNALLQDSLKRRQQKIMWLKRFKQIISKDLYSNKTDEELEELIKLTNAKKMFYINSTLHWQNKKEEWVNFSTSERYLKERVKKL